MSLIDLLSNEDVWDKFYHYKTSLCCPKAFSGYLSGFISDRAYVPVCEAINENKIDLCFRAAAECTEEAILNAMASAEKIIGYTGKFRLPLSDFTDLLS